MGKAGQPQARGHGGPGLRSQHSEAEAWGSTRVGTYTVSLRPVLTIQLALSQTETDKQNPRPLPFLQPCKIHSGKKRVQQAQTRLSSGHELQCLNTGIPALDNPLHSARATLT